MDSADFASVFIKHKMTPIEELISIFLFFYSVMMFGMWLSVTKYQNGRAVKSALLFVLRKLEDMLLSKRKIDL